MNHLDARRWDLGSSGLATQHQLAQSLFGQRACWSGFLRGFRKVQKKLPSHLMNGPTLHLHLHQQYRSPLFVCKWAGGIHGTSDAMGSARRSTIHSLLLRLLEASPAARQEPRRKHRSVRVSSPVRAAAFTLATGRSL